MLDPDGRLVGQVHKSLGATDLVDLYRSMLRGRMFDELQMKLQRRGDIGTFAPVKGQEAQVGAAAALSREDWFVPSFRETAASLHRGADPKQILLYNAGFNEGAAVGEGDRSLPVAIPVASQLPHAVGIGYAMLRKQESSVVMVFFGDGATSEGDFHEAMNFAAVFNVPVIFFCQNNQWAISTPRSRQSASTTLAQKSMAYGMPGLQVDGNDVLAVHRVARQAVKRARKGLGPTFIEALTYRLEVHTTADDPSKYRDEDEERRAAAKEPLLRMSAYLRGAGLWDDTREESTRAEFEIELDNAWRAAQQVMSEVDEAEDPARFLFAEAASADVAASADKDDESRGAEEDDNGEGGRG